jgi:hypothetical protein
LSNLGNLNISGECSSGSSVICSQVYIVDCSVVQLLNVSILLANWGCGAKLVEHFSVEKSQSRWLDLNNFWDKGPEKILRVWRSSQTSSEYVSMIKIDICQEVIVEALTLGVFAKETFEEGISERGLGHGIIDVKEDSCDGSKEIFFSILIVICMYNMHLKIVMVTIGCIFTSIIKSIVSLGSMSSMEMELLSGEFECCVWEPLLCQVALKEYIRLWERYLKRMALVWTVQVRDADISIMLAKSSVRGDNCVISCGINIDRALSICLMLCF